MDLRTGASSVWLHWGLFYPAPFARTQPEVVLDLFTVTPLQVRALMDRCASDPRLLRPLARLEAAAESGDELERMEAIGELSDLLVLERGL